MPQVAEVLVSDETPTLDERLLELLELQREQLDILRDQKNSSEASLLSIDSQLVQNRAENSSMFRTIDTRLTRVEGNLDVVINQQHHSISLVAGLDARTAEQGRRLSDLAHRAIRLETGVAAIDAKTELMQMRCAAHDEQISKLGCDYEELKEHLADHEDEGDKQFKEVSGELRIVERDVKGRIVEVNGNAKELRTKIDQSWKVIGIILGGLVTLIGLILAAMKFLLPMLMIATLAGCYKHTIYGKYTMAYDRTDLMTIANCYRPADAIKVSDIALPIIYAELQKAGYIKDLPALQKAVKQHTLICLIPKPEPCVFGKIPAVPWKEINGRIVGARKAGCSTDLTAWASIEYPFLCSEDWPDEPGCVTDSTKIFSTKWPSTLVHELLNVIVARVASSALPAYDLTGKLVKGYSGPIYSEIEPKINQRFSAQWK